LIIAERLASSDHYFSYAYDEPGTQVLRDSIHFLLNQWYPSCYCNYDKRKLSYFTYNIKGY